MHSSLTGPNRDRNDSILWSDFFVVLEIASLKVEFRRLLAESPSSSDSSVSSPMEYVLLADTSTNLRCDEIHF